MVSRRSVLAGAMAIGAGVAATRLAWPGEEPAYRGFLSESRKPVAIWPAAERSLAEELVRFAVLAANSHNSQPWLFVTSRGGFRIKPDLKRRCPVVDPEDRHLIASLGCATENLVLAAEAAGFHADVDFDPASRTTTINLDRSIPQRVPAFLAITKRQSTRAPFAPDALPSDEIRSLESASRIPGVHAHMLTARDQLHRLRDLVVAGNTAQCNDRAFVAELRDWVRFNQAQAVATRDGLYAGASGNPNVPSWLGRIAFARFFTAASENPKYVAQLDGSAGAVILSPDKDDPAGWFNVGRAGERFQLEATVRDIRTSFVNQPVEVAAARQDLMGWLGDGLRPGMIIRFGRGSSLPWSLRRPPSAVLEQA